MKVLPEVERLYYDLHWAIIMDGTDFTKFDEHEKNIVHKCWLYLQILYNLLDSPVQTANDTHELSSIEVMIQNIGNWENGWLERLSEQIQSVSQISESIDRVSNDTVHEVF